MTAAFYISLVLLFIAVLRFLVALFNYLTRPYLPYRNPSGSPLVSVLIPARNEEANIGVLLNCLVRQQYEHIEIIVYNDGSTDGTEASVRDAMRYDERIGIINGSELPEGWLGKNHACYQLANRAKGDYLLFLDADVSVSSNFVGNAVAQLQRRRLVLLSMFPRQVTKTWGELLVVPNMNWILLSLLPLRLVQWSRKRSLAAANGQMMLFEARQYYAQQWHQQFRNSVVEDITISRAIKRKHMRMATLLGSDDISCRMYRGYSDALNGFSKNLCAFFGGSTYVTLVYALTGTLAPFLILFTLPFPLSFAFFFSMLSARMMVSDLSGQSVIKNVLLWPLQHAVLLLMAYKSIRFYRGKSLTWKGRSIN